VWWLESRLSLEREMACDECVLAETQNARAYAKSLANIAERSFVHRTIALAQAAVSRLHDTTLRVARILSPAPRRTASKLATFASVVALSGATVGVAAYSPNLVGFSEPAPVVASADFPTPALMKTVSMPISETPAIVTKKVISKPAVKPPVIETVDTPTVAHAQQPSLYVPAKAAAPRHQVPPQQAMLVVWQETYSDGYVTIQQSYWRVVVLHPTASKEQPAKIT
jgi:hypothetical protein